MQLHPPFPRRSLHPTTRIKHSPQPQPAAHHVTNRATHPLGGQVQVQAFQPVGYQPRSRPAGRAGPRAILLRLQRSSRGPTYFPPLPGVLRPDPPGPDPLPPKSASTVHHLRRLLLQDQLATLPQKAYPLVALPQYQCLPARVGDHHPRPE